MIRWSVLAIRQLEAIDAMISADNPQAAAKQCRLIFEAVMRLETFPFAGKQESMSRYRRLAAAGTPYVIFYRVTANAVFIRSIWHGARLPPRLL